MPRHLPAEFLDSTPLWPSNAASLDSPSSHRTALLEPSRCFLRLLRDILLVMMTELTDTDQPNGVVSK